MAPRLRLAEARLERSEIHRRGESHRVFVTGSETLYRLMNGQYYAAIARNVWAHRISVEHESFDEVIEIEEPFPALLEEAVRAATAPP